MIPGLAQAKAVQEKINRVGIQDVQLFYDSQLGMWGVYQVRRTTGHILTYDNVSGTKVEPLLMFWCKDARHKYRDPNETDVVNVVAIVQRAQVTFQKGGDWLADQLDAADEVREAKGRVKLDEDIRRAAKPLKKYIKKELG